MTSPQQSRPSADPCHRFDGQGGYLDTACYGLPPRATLAAMADGLTAWGAGEPTAADHDDTFNEARRLFASIVGVDVSTVALGSQTSVVVGMIASSLRAGSEVLLAEGDFTSLVYPFLVAADRQVTVRFAPLEELSDHVRSSTDLVAVSAVQSRDGRVVDVDRLLAATADVGARVLLDTTQSAGWLPIDTSRVDYTVTSAYKWLMAPRGTAFLTVTPDALAELRPTSAGWYAGDDIWQSVYGRTMRLAPSARRLDVSPAWLAWHGAVPSLRLVQEVGPERIGQHDVGLANQFRAALELPAGASPIVSLDVPEADAAALADHGVRASVRDGCLRLSFHLYNTTADVERAADLLGDRELRAA